MSREHDREALDAAQKTSNVRPRPAPGRVPEEDVRRSVGNSGMSQLLEPSTTDTIEAELGGGKPIASVPGARAAVRGEKDVRIHDDGTAADLSREMGAVAFTFGRDIFLSGNAPDLASSDGQAMLRHELTHVDQQAESGTTRPKRVSSPDSPAEQQAAHAQRGGTAAAGTSSAGAVHRQEEQEEDELMMMRAETVHRQEEQEEDELMMMRAETVHRIDDDELTTEEQAQQAATTSLAVQVPVEAADPGAATAADTAEAQDVAGESDEGPEPRNPALAALFEHSVISQITSAQEHMATDPPEAEAALRRLNEAGLAVRALIPTYLESDPLLASELRVLRAATISSINEIWPLSERQPDVEHAREQLAALLNGAGRIPTELH